MGALLRQRVADVMESYRGAVGGPAGAAWDAMLRHSARETLITDEQAYSHGGLSCIFQPFAQANNPELGKKDYNPEEPVSWILYLDFNAMNLPQ